MRRSGQSSRRLSYMVGPAVGCLVLVLAGCSGGGTTTDATDAADAPPASASAPDAPGSSAMEVTTPREVIRRWFAARNRLMAIGDRTPFDRLSIPSCIYCLTFGKAIGKIYRDGGHVEGGIYREITGLRLVTRTKRRLDFTLWVSIGDTTAYDASGRVIDSATGVVRDPRDLSLLVTDAGLKVLEFGQG